MAKKYYWLKLREDFFEREEIKIIEQMENGKDYIIFYMKLLLRSVKTDGILKFKDILPYDPKMLSVITNTNIDIVRSAIDLFTHFGMMEKWDDGTLFMVETVNMIGSESESAERMRRLRARQKQKQLVEGASQCDADVQECDTDIDIDIEIEQQQEPEQESEKNAEKQKELEQQEDVVAVFSKHGINIQAVLKKYPDAAQRDVDWEIVASTLAAKKAAGKIANPVGLLMADPAGIIDDILGGRFYPDLPPPKKKKSFGGEDTEIYVSPIAIERLTEQTETL